jgi:hypothetical protein
VSLRQMAPRFVLKDTAAFPCNFASSGFLQFAVLRAKELSASQLTVRMIGLLTLPSHVSVFRAL